MVVGPTSGAGGGDLWDTEHRRRLRAERVRALLADIWGDELPCGRDPVATLLVDAIAADDHHGAVEDLVVQSDGLTLGNLAELVRSSSPGRRTDLVPPELLQRLPLDGVPTSGAWEWRVDTGVFAWDACCARLIGYGDEPGGAPLDVVLHQRIHPDDRAAIVEGLHGTATTGRPYRVDFRVVRAGAARRPLAHVDWLSAKGRLIDFPVDQPPRVIGFIGRRAEAPVPGG